MEGMMKTIMMLLFAVVLAGSAYAAGVTVDYQVNNQTYEGYYLSNNKGAPLVLLVHDWDGLTDYEVKRAEMLAELGYAVFAADLFGKGVRPTEMVDKRQHTGALYKDRAKLRALLQGALNAAREQGGNVENAVSMGYCFGGAAVLEQARSGANLKGFVTFHGGLSTPEGQDYSKAKGKMLIMHGSAVSNITMQDFADLASQLEQNGITHEMITYGGAPHAFTVFGSPRYRADADAKSWQRFVEYLATTLN
jgi:dienelactone hydrolase